VPGIALHPSDALIYQPFLTSAPGSAGVKGGIDILDAHSGARRLQIFLPQQFLTDVDGLHGSFLTTDENGQRLFAITSSDGTPQNTALTVVQLAAVPLGVGAITPSGVAATGGATLTIRGSGFQSATTLTINGKAASVTFKHASTLLVITPRLTPGSQQIAITNPDGETVSLDAAFIANYCKRLLVSFLSSGCVLTFFAVCSSKRMNKQIRCAASSSSARLGKSG
jgi:hypothetical protein